MKLDARRVDAFLANPGSARIVLFHGEDVGLARDRATRLTVAVAGSSNDPFAVVDLDHRSIVTLSSEMLSLSMTGARRVIRVRDCGDFAVEPMRRSLSGDGRGLVIAEAGILPARSKLRAFVETSDAGMAVLCVPPTRREKTTLLCAKLATVGITVDEDAIAWMASRAVDRGTAEQDADKLVNFAGPTGHLSVEEVAACIDEIGAASLDEALFAATAGLADVWDRAYASAIADGAAAIQVLRAGLQHLHRLLEIKAAVRRGVAVLEAGRSARPPVSARMLPLLEIALRIWNEKRLEAMSGQILRAERACKQTGAPADVIAQYAIMRIWRGASETVDASRSSKAITE